MKKLLISFGVLAFGIGGAALGLSTHVATQEVKADSVSNIVYLDIGNSGWGAKISEGVDFYAHYWGGTATAETTWPGAKLSSVDGLVGLYSIDIGDSTELAFNVNVSAGTWHGDCQTVDLTPESGKVFTITGKDTNQENKLTGVWEARPASKTFYVLDKYGDLLNNSAKAHLFQADKNGPYTNWPGVNFEDINDYPQIHSITVYGKLDTVVINQIGDGKKTGQSIDLTIQDGKCLYLTHDDDNYKWNSNKWIDLEAAKYIDKYLHFEDFDESDQTQGTACLGADGYYQKAFDAYTSLSSDAKNDVGEIPEVAARLNAWATANGKSFTAGDGFGIMSIQTIQSEYSVATVGITVIAAVVVVGFISFIAIRKRKTNI